MASTITALRQTVSQTYPLNHDEEVPYYALLALLTHLG